MTSILKVSEIQDPTNGNTALTVDTSGRILQPAKPVFYAIGNNTGFVSAAGSTQILTDWDTTGVEYINQGGMSYSSGRVTVPVAGIYRITAKVMSKLILGEYIVLRPTRNGTILNNSQAYVAGGTQEHQDTLTSNILAQCLANDIIDISITASGTSVEYYLSSYSNFGIELVS